MKIRLSGFRLSELLKFLMAVLFGYTLRTLTDVSTPKEDCPKCVQCKSMDLQGELIHSDIHQQLREQYKPKSMYDILRYDYFNTKHVFNNFDDDPRIGLRGYQKADIKDIVTQAMTLFKSVKMKQWKLNRLIQGYSRLDPIRGQEYVLDLNMSAADTPKKFENYRLQVVKPFQHAQLISDKRLTANKMVHFILPVSKVADRLDAFLNEFEVICQQVKEHMYLLIVLFSVKTERDKQSAEGLIETTTSISRRQQNAHIRVIQTKRAFSRALGLDLGAQQLPSEALMFFCDVDVVISKDFLTRCRHNAVLGKQVYYPIVFAQYSPSIALYYSPRGAADDLMDINKYTGHWVHYGFGMTCLYKQDYHAVGGLNKNIKGWGGEDVDLYIKHTKSHLNVFRAMDPALVHRYHDKKCNRNLTADQYRMCIGALAEGYGSKSQLAKKVLMVKDKDTIDR